MSLVSQPEFTHLPSTSRNGQRRMGNGRHAVGHVEIVLYSVVLSDCRSTLLERPAGEGPPLLSR
jgi:hypothetical protein